MGWFLPFRSANMGGTPSTPVFAVGDAMDKLPDLLTDLAISDTPSGRLDREVGRMLGWKLVGLMWQSPDHERHVWLPRWTASTDAALTLVPAGTSYLLGHSTGGGTFAYVGEPVEPRKEARAQTLPMAVVSAALRHRFAVELELRKAVPAPATAPPE